MWWYHAQRIANITSQRIHGRHRSIQFTVCHKADESARMDFSFAANQRILFELVHRWWADGMGVVSIPGLACTHTHTLTLPNTHNIMIWQTRVVAIPHHRINMNNLMKQQTSTGDTFIHRRRTTARGINYTNETNSKRDGANKKLITGKYNQHDDTTGHWAFDSDLFMNCAWIGTKINRNRPSMIGELWRCLRFYGPRMPSSIHVEDVTWWRWGFIAVWWCLSLYYCLAEKSRLMEKRSARITCRVSNMCARYLLIIFLRNIQLPT